MSLDNCKNKILVCFSSKFGSEVENFRQIMVRVQDLLVFCPLTPIRSNNSNSTVRSAESVGVRQPAKSKIRRHNNRFSTVFNQSPNLRDGGQHVQVASGSGGSLSGDLQVVDDPAELSSQMSIPGILKIFGSDICQGTNYKSVLATTQSSAKELVKQALERQEVFSWS